MTADTLIHRLDGVRQIGHSRWLARCPAHNDRRASLAVRELDDGRVLAHCFAGCNVDEVVGAVGLTLASLFPPTPAGVHAQQGERRPYPAVDVLRAICFEVQVAAVAAMILGNGGTLTDADRRRLLLAAERLLAAADMAGVRP